MIEEQKALFLRFEYLDALLESSRRILEVFSTFIVELEALIAAGHVVVKDDFERGVDVNPRELLESIGYCIRSTTIFVVAVELVVIWLAAVAGSSTCFAGCVPSCPIYRVDPILCIDVVADPMPRIHHEAIWVRCIRSLHRCLVQAVYICSYPILFINNSTEE